MKRAIGSPNKKERERQDRIRELGCICCWLDGHGMNPCEIHHLNDCGRNIGHDATIGGCAWHHRGVPPGDMRPSEATLVLGPSLARDPAAFHERYGEDEELLFQQNTMLRTYADVAIG
jgi:hypothetical protein